MQMVLETKSGLEGAVIGGGHSIAAARLDAQRSVAGWVSEQMGGLSYLFYIRDLVRHSQKASQKAHCTPTVPICVSNNIVQCVMLSAPWRKAWLPGINCFNAHMYIFVT